MIIVNQSITLCEPSTTCCTSGVVYRKCNLTLADSIHAFSDLFHLNRFTPQFIPINQHGFDLSLRPIPEVEPYPFKLLIARRKSSCLSGNSD